MRALKLPFHFDPEKLRADLARVAADEWIPHINRRHYDGQWSGAALRSLGGAAGNLAPEARGDAAFEDTALLARCPYFREVLGTLRCPLLSARLLRLHAGSSIAEHVDHALDFDDGEVRLHVPVVTSDEVRFYLDGSRLVMAPGECWYTNVNLPHSVENGGATDRIHLVVDCRVDDWLRTLFATIPRPVDPCYAALVQLPRTGAGAIVPMLSAFADSRGAGGDRVEFRVEGGKLLLHWPGQRSWQFRLTPSLPTSEGEPLALRIESSPDAACLHRPRYEALLAHLRQAFPEAGVTETVRE